MVVIGWGIVPFVTAWSAVAYAAALPNPQYTPELNFYFPNTSTPTPFEISVNPAFIDETQWKVKHFRPSKSVFSEWTNEGPAPSDISALTSHWAHKYKWSKIQKEINQNLTHYATTVPGNGEYQSPIPFHFVHEKSSTANATPLLLLHGWPSSYLEWARVIKPLASNKNASFHVVAPDLPGFGFSPAPIHPLGPREIGVALDALMHQLGYDRYGIVTTDLGYFIGNWMVKDVGSSIIGHFSDFQYVPPNATDQARFAANQTTEEETAYMLREQNWFANHSAYATVHEQKPYALALALADSPVGMAGWVWDLVHTISDGFEYDFDELITQALMLYIPGVYGNIHLYQPIFKPDILAYPETSIPTGITQWAMRNELDPAVERFLFVPREWLERTANVVHFSRHDTGGHFPAIKEPENWQKEVREFFTSIAG